jgi:hypothetical protein
MSRIEVTVAARVSFEGGDFVLDMLKRSIDASKTKKSQLTLEVFRVDGGEAFRIGLDPGTVDAGVIVRDH